MISGYGTLNFSPVPYCLFSTLVIPDDLVQFDMGIDTFEFFQRNATIKSLLTRKSISLSLKLSSLAKQEPKTRRFCFFHLKQQTQYEDLL